MITNRHDDGSKVEVGEDRQVCELVIHPFNPGRWTHIPVADSKDSFRNNNAEGSLEVGVIIEKFNGYPCRVIKIHVDPWQRHPIFIDNQTCQGMSDGHFDDSKVRISEKQA